LFKTLAVKVPDAVPLVGETCSQLPPVIGETDAVNPVVPPVAVIVTVCEPGGVPPWDCVKVSEVGETETVLFDEIVSTTGMVNAPLGSVALLFALIEIEPV
jgi:hypothetical protein